MLMSEVKKPGIKLYILCDCNYIKIRVHIEKNKEILKKDSNYVTEISNGSLFCFLTFWNIITSFLK